MHAQLPLLSYCGMVAGCSFYLQVGERKAEQMQQGTPEQAWSKGVYFIGKVCITSSLCSWSRDTGNAACLALIELKAPALGSGTFGP